MIRAMFFMLIVLLGLTVFSGCGLQTSSPPKISEERIIEHLPITINDRFELTSGWHYYNYPYAKTDFSESELMIVHRAISSFEFYGNSHPWSDEGIAGMPPVLHAANEDQDHKIAIYFITHSNWGTIALAVFDEDPEIHKWFTMDSDAFDEITGLLR